jgi:hypothetical protein
MEDSVMEYELQRLAPGSYDVLHHGIIIASLVRNGAKNDATWTAELLEEMLPGARPAPFILAEKTFGSLEEAGKWLGVSVLQDPAE